jgi:hypothetical protein
LEFVAEGFFVVLLGFQFVVGLAGEVAGAVLGTVVEFAEEFTGGGVGDDSVFAIDVEHRDREAFFGIDEEDGGISGLVEEDVVRDVAFGATAEGFGVAVGVGPCPAAAIGASDLAEGVTGLEEAVEGAGEGCLGGWDVVHLEEGVSE